MKLWFSNKGKKAGDILAGWQKDAKSRIPDLSKNIAKLPKNFDLAKLQSYAKEVIKGLSNSGSSSSVPQRPRAHMKFPYTLTAKCVQFPYKFYYKNNFIARTYPWGFALCAPLFWYISKKVNSPENKAKWREIRRKEVEEYKHKFD